MLRLKFAIVGAGITALMALSTPEANAFCGGIERTAEAASAQDAVAKADQKIRHDLKALKKEYGKQNVVLDGKSVNCVGGDSGKDAQGKRKKGFSRCTVTQGFCVNR
jgi:hypothetical protein